MDLPEGPLGCWGAVFYAAVSRVTGVAKGSAFTHQSVDVGAAVAAEEVIGAHVGVGLIAVEQAVGDHEYGVINGDRRLATRTGPLRCRYGVTGTRPDLMAERPLSLGNILATH